MFFTNASDFQVNGETAGTWRTLSKAEWDYLLNSRANASSLRAWKKLDEGTHKGLVILPDGTENPSEVLGCIESVYDLASSGAVFLPAAGFRNGTFMCSVGPYDYYWSSSPIEGYEGEVYYLDFDSGDVGTHFGGRNDGYSVRLVR